MKYFRGATAVEVVAVRLDDGDDLLACLNRVVNELQLEAGALLSGSGTLHRFRLQTVATTTSPPAVTVMEKEGAGQIVAAHGVIAGGEIAPSLTVAWRGETCSGSAMEGCVVFQSAELVLLRAGGTRWTRTAQDAAGLPVLDAAGPPGASAAAQGTLQLMGRPLDMGAVALVPASLIRRHQAVPVARTADTLVVAMVDPNNPFAIDDFRAASGLRIQAVAVPPRDLVPLLERLLSGGR